MAPAIAGLVLAATTALSLHLPSSETLATLGFPWSEDAELYRNADATPVVNSDAAVPSIQNQAEQFDDRRIDGKAQWNSLLALPTNQLKVAEYYAEKYGIDKAHISRIVALANQSGIEANINPLMILAIISHESNFQPWVRNKSGAEGLMQVMTQIHKEKFDMFGGTDTTFDPAVNIRVGTLILRECIAIKRSIRGGLRYYAGAENEAIDDGGFVEYVSKEVERLSELLAIKPKNLHIHFPIKR
jgi:hypothetical protein